MQHVQVKKCEVTRCCFNKDTVCHAHAIQVGDDKPLCDTFSPIGVQCGMPDEKAEVGACKVSMCKFNRSLICQAPGITVSWKENTAECVTYEPK